jgi:O-antigen ligase
MHSPVAETIRNTSLKDEAQSKSRAAVWLDRIVVFWLFVFALSAPHSIAATQVAWSAGLLFWAARFVVRPRPRLFRTPVDYALLGLFILTFISSLLSYDADVSIGKLRAASLFTIVYLVAENVRSNRVLRLLALTLIVSCMVNVFYAFGERVVGRGLKVEGVAGVSPLRSGVFVAEDGRETLTPIQDGVTILEVDGKPLRSPDQLVAALGDTAKNGAALLRIYRVEWMPTLRVARGQLLERSTALEKLGLTSWGRGRDWRAAGFYGQYVTYAEALQLIASLVLGLFIALRKKRSRQGALLAVAFAGMCGALLLTVTRASWLALLLSAFVITLVGMSRRAMLISRRAMMITVGLALPLVVAGLFVLQQQRQVGFYDQNDQSITWRETVWREGFDLLTASPRHMLVGVGMDSIKRHWREWGLFDNGRIPVGHMHSTPLQLAVERGIPVLLVWILLLAVYAGMLWRLARDAKVEGWIERGIVLGALGGLVGFISSGMVHYNLGDSEVAMIFYFIMGLSLVVERLSRNGGSDSITIGR